MPVSRTLIWPTNCSDCTHWRTSLTLIEATSVMAAPENFTARAVALSLVPWQLGQAWSIRSSTSASAKLCSRPW